MNIGLILLAAGNSSRLGGSKQLLDIDGEPLLLRSTKIALQSGASHVVVVLGSQAEAHQPILQNLLVEVVINKDWEKGIGNSLKAGLNHLLHINPNVEAAMVMVCDQPQLSSAILKALIRKREESKKSIVASFYSGTAGTPAIFDKSLFQKLLSLQDDQGAKKIIQQNPSFTTTVDFPGGEVDIDTMDDLMKFQQNKKAI